MNSSPTLSGPIFFSKMTAFFMFAFKVQSPLEQQPSAPPPPPPPTHPFVLTGHLGSRQQLQMRNTDKEINMKGTEEKESKSAKNIFNHQV